MIFHQEGLDNLVMQRLELEGNGFDLSDWEKFVEKTKFPKNYVRIGICGKYTKLTDSYKSIIEAFAHAGVENDSRVELNWISSENIEKEGAEKHLSELDGGLIPGGLGDRG